MVSELIEARFYVTGRLWWKKLSCQSCWCLVKPRHATDHARVCGRSGRRPGNPGKPENVRETTVYARVDT